MQQTHLQIATLNSGGEYHHPLALKDECLQGKVHGAHQSQPCSLPNCILIPPREQNLKTNTSWSNCGPAELLCHGKAVQESWLKGASEHLHPVMHVVSV